MEDRLCVCGHNKSVHDALGICCASLCPCLRLEIEDELPADYCPYCRQKLPSRGETMEEIVKTFVLTDILKRVEAGENKYGTYLKTNNGRDALWDAYEEAIDLVFYLRQAILERQEKTHGQQ